MNESLIPASIRAATATILGCEPAAWREVRGGYTAAARYVVEGPVASAFVKFATTPESGKLILQEIDAYSAIAGPFVPTLFGFDRNAEHPLLIIEDLTSSKWPPPWDPELIRAVLTRVDLMHSTSAPGLRSSASASDRLRAGWSVVAEDPSHFLSLELGSPRWLERCLPDLIDAAENCNLEGTGSSHLDLRSDNICLTPEGVKFVDWAEAALVDPRVDLGFWLPSLHFEGGPPPDEILPDAPDVASLVAGFFAARAGQPGSAIAPLARAVQREQLSVALPWVIRALGLAPLDGAKAAR